MKSYNLSDISKSITSGLTPLRSNKTFWEAGSIPWLKTEQLGVKYIYDTNEKISTDALKNTSIKINPINTISIAMYGEGKTRGSVAILKKEMATNQACCNIVIDPKKADLEYVYYFLTGQYNNLRSLASGVRKNLNSNDIKNFKIILPDLITDQKKVSSILKTIDDKIEINNKINAELEQMTKTLYNYWFVQFDFPDANGNPYKSFGSAMVYNKELKSEIPKYWSVVSLRSLIATSKNGDWGEDKPNENLMKVYCVRGADINALNGESETLDPPVRYIRKDHADRLLNPDDLIVEISGGSPAQSTGRIAHIGEKVSGRFESPLVCSNFCKAISLKENTYSYIVKQYWNKLYEAGIFFNFEGKTSGIKNLMFDRLIQDVHLAIPSDSKLIEEFYKFSIKNDEMIQNNLLQNKKLGELRDWLLPMLMNGQIRLKD